ncbi:MAG: bifunctional DNA-binding transcriptional regulator/O6-methylguanine-DNA methyltransferase Ada [Anaerolineae bacterium]|nr:bifunctional DNA-binding transcriptional regulator/O6-methylguanine-DNA methyltransferase Ada [Anaerolineae bacterium]
MTAETDVRWQAVARRDQAANGQFVYAVRTTGVYCRPSCASRQPRRENVTFFALPALAEAAGYRACKRCHPREAHIADSRALLAQEVAAYLAAHIDDSAALALEAIGAAVGYAPGHVSAVFKDVLGVTPRQYAEALRLQAFKAHLRDGLAVTEAIYAAGYGSPSRVYEQAGGALGMTPAAYRRGGAGVTIAYSLRETQLGWLLAGQTERGLCAVGLYDDPVTAETALCAEFPQAELTRDDRALAARVDAIVAHLDGHSASLDLPLDVRATAFQRRVWQALRAIPSGETRTYSQIAAAIGQPAAVRAVAGACANNRAAIVIPCHRVIGKDGSLAGYRWGIERKRALLELEAQEQPDLVRA